MKTSSILSLVSGSMVAMLLTSPPMSAAPINFNGVRYQAIMLAPNYVGGPVFAPARLSATSSQFWNQNRCLEPSIWTSSPRYARRGRGW